jgi:uncharacterized protein
MANSAAWMAGNGRPKWGSCRYEWLGSSWRDRQLEMTEPGSTPEQPAVTPSPAADRDRFREVHLVGIRVEAPSNSPVVVLKEDHGNRYLPIRVGAVEATVIAFAQQGMVSLRPLTHDLFRDVLKAVDVQLLSVRIKSVADGIFDADLVLSNGSIVSSRPCDGIALAVRTDASVLASHEVLAQEGVDLGDVPGEAQAGRVDSGEVQPSGVGEAHSALSEDSRDSTIPEPGTLLMKEMKLVGVRVEMPSESPIALLKEANGNWYLPIWIGAVEATAIRWARQGKVSPRPLTHELLRDVLEAVDVQLLSARITSLTDGIFNGVLVLSNGKNVRARPSDAIALATHTGAMIEASTEVIEKAGVEVPDEQAATSD